MQEGLSPLLRAGECNEHPRHFLQRFDGDILVDAVEVQTACGEVRAGQTLPAQTRAVRAAADGDDARRNICGTHGGLRVFDKVHVGENFFLIL